jgi:hypothetical protein
MSDQDLRDADAAWLKALLARDGSTAARILHDEFALVLVHPEPARVEREEWLRTLVGYEIASWAVRGSAWDVRPEFAVTPRSP